MAPIDLETDSILAYIIPGILFLLVFALPEILKNKDNLLSLMKNAVSISSGGISIAQLTLILGIIIVAGRLMNYIRIRIAYVPSSFRLAAYWASDDTSSLPLNMAVRMKIAGIFDSIIESVFTYYNKIMKPTIINTTLSEEVNIFRGGFEDKRHERYKKEQIIESIANEKDVLKSYYPKDVYTEMLRRLEGKETERLKEIRSVFVLFKNIFITVFLASFLRLIMLFLEYIGGKTRVMEGGPTIKLTVIYYLAIIFLTFITWTYVKSFDIDQSYTDQLFLEYSLNYDTDIDIEYD